MPERSAHLDPFPQAQLPPPEQWPLRDFSSLPELAAYPPRLNCAALLLDAPAERCPDRPVLRARGETWSYAELRTRADRIAAVLQQDLGVVPGNRVLLRGPNSPMLVAAWFAVMKLGAVAVATMPLLRARELTFMAEKAKIAVGLCDARLKQEMEATLERSGQLERVLYWGGGEIGCLEARMAEMPERFETADTAAEDICLIAFTSGTTGPPKGCMHAHRDVMAICDTFSRYLLQPRADDIFAGSPPIAFTFGLGALVTFPMHAAASTVLLEQCTPEHLLRTIEQERVSVLFTAPTVYRAMTPLAHGFDLGALRLCVSAGETLPLPTWQGWHAATGLRIIDGIGSTELLHIFIAAAGSDIRPGATGKPIPGYRARVVDDAGRELPPGTVGRLAVQGPTGCRYLDDPERQAAYVQGGWNFTGDAYRMDADGYFWYQARTDDMIISAGYNISGPEIEAVLLEHPKVAECAVVGVPDPERGHIVKAYVVLQHGVAGDAAMTQELQDFVKGQIAPYKYPRLVEYLDALPRTQTGKVQRFVLRQRDAAADHKA